MAVAQFAMFMGVLFGVLPAMLVLYLMLDRYEAYFEDKRVFKFLVVGVIAGTLVTALEVMIGIHEPTYLAAIPWSTAVLLLGVGYSALEGLVKVVILNYPSVVKRKDAPFYAAPVGLGMGAAATFILLARGIVFTSEDPTFQALSHWQVALTYIPVVELFVGGILIHAFTATIVADMTSRGEPFRAFAAATILTVPFYVTYYLVYAVALPLWGVLLPTGLLVYGIVGVRKVMTQLLDHVVPPEIAQQVRRAIRQQRLEERKSGKA